MKFFIDEITEAERLSDLLEVIVAEPEFKTCFHLLSYPASIISFFQKPSANTFNSQLCSSALGACLLNKTPALEPLNVA